MTNKSPLNLNSPEKPIVKLKPNPWRWLLKSPGKTVEILVTALFIIPLIPHIVDWLNLITTQYYITDKRIRIEDGIFNLKVKEVLLFRVIDLQIRRPFLYRFFHISDLWVYSLDVTEKTTILKGIPSDDAEKLLNILQDFIKIDRRTNRADIGGPGFY